MDNFVEECLSSLLILVNNAVVFIDDACAEYLHWSNGFSRLLTAGALDVRDIKHCKECLESENKAVFVISTPINGQVMKYFQRIIRNSDFTHCIIVSTLSQECNEFIYHGVNPVPVFEQTIRKLKSWMQNDFATVTVHCIPLGIMELMQDTFVNITHGSLFPVLPSDVARLQAFLHSRGDKRIFKNLGEVDFGFLPHNTQCQIKNVASSFNTMFESLNFNEDCYAVGHFSRLVATELANMPDARGRRKMASSRASAVFIDRTLDLVAPISHTSDCVLGTMYEILPRLLNHNNDVAVDMTMLFSEGNVLSKTLFPGCLSHPGDKDVADVMQRMLMNSKKSCINYICKKLRDILKDENVSAEINNDIENINALKNLLLKFRNNVKLFKQYSGFLQCAVAFYNSLTDNENEHLDELLSAEKVILLDLGSREGDPFAQVLRLLSQKENKRFNVVDALMFCLFIYSATDDISNTSPAYEEKLKEALINILMDGDHKEDVLFLIGDLDASERQVRTRIADIFERLRGIGEARSGMTSLRSLIKTDDYGIRKYKPLIVQILERIFDPARTDLTDIEFRSHGFKDFLKTGFGFFMNVSKPRPDDHPTIILFVVGGITWYELHCVKETLKRIKPKQKVIIGSTRILTPSDTLEQVLCSENLFVDVDT